MTKRLLEGDPHQPMLYQVRIQGQLDAHWQGWFEGFAITLDGNGNTLLSGPVADQAALHGLLKRVRDLGVPLLSVVRVDAGHADTSDESNQYRSDKEIHDE